MRNELFYMSTSILSVWKEGSFKTNCAMTWVCPNDLEYKTFVFSNDDDGLNVILEVFGDRDVEFTGSKIFMTRVPSQIFLKAAKQRKVAKVFFLKNLQDYVIPDEFFGIAQVFNHDFGKIIDTFEQVETIGTNKHKYLL
jgi:hypothetical protein